MPSTTGWLRRHACAAAILALSAAGNAYEGKASAGEAAGSAVAAEAAPVPGGTIPPPAIPDLSGYAKADRIGNILFWVGQAKIPVLALFSGKEWNLIPFLALYGVQETGMGMNYYANRSYLSAYRGMGGETSFLRTGAGTLYLVDKALAVAAIGAIVYGAAEDDSGLVIAGGLGAVFVNLLDFYVWHQLRQSNNEAASAVRNWNVGVGLRNRGAGLEITYSIR